MKDIDVQVSPYKLLNMTIRNRGPKPIPNDTASKAVEYGLTVPLTRFSLVSLVVRLRWVAK